MSKASVLRDQAAGYGFASVFSEYDKMIGRAQGIEKDLAALRSAAEADRSKVVRDIAAGKRVEPASVVDAGHRYAAWATDGPAAIMLVHAAAACRNDGEAAAMRAVPRLFAAMVAEVDQVVRESVALAAKLPDSVRDTATAVRARGDVPHLWADLGVLGQRWLELHALHGLLMEADLVPRYETTSKDPNASWLRYEHPEWLPGDTADERWLAVAHAAGAGPGLFPADEAMQRRRLLVRDDYEKAPPAGMQWNTGPMQTVGTVHPTSGQFIPAGVR